MAGRRTFAMAALSVAALIVVASPALAGSSTAPAGSSGHDVSYPQCTSSGSSSTTVGSLGGSFGIVGVTNGLPWSANSCLASEDAWASGLVYQPGLYANTANPAPHSSFYWPTSGSSDPALCRNAASTTDPGCAYDYGWHAAADALSTAQRRVAGAAGLPWWLDVEIANSWNGDGTSNTADLQGGVDYLRTQGVPSVGIYSSTGDWDTITGGYTVSDASTYSTAWSPEFSAQYPLSTSPTWVAGAGSLSTASSVCGGAAFTGTQPQLAQYADGSGYDADLVCGIPAPSFTMSVDPTAGSVAQGGSSTATVTVSESGGTQQVGLSAAGQPAGVSVGFSPASLSASGSSTMSVAVGTTVTPGSYPLTITAMGTSGTETASYTLTVGSSGPNVVVSLNPASGRVKRGGSTSSTVTLTEQGTTQSVALSATVSSSQIHATVSPSRLGGPGTATLTVTTARSTPAGTYTVSVNASGATAAGAASFALTVR